MPPKSATTTTPKEPRKPSAYNIFMKDEMARVKAVQPTLDHKEIFKIAAGNWKIAKGNPTNDGQK